MNREQRVAFILSQVACAQAEIAGMQIANQVDIMKGELPTYNQQAFQEVSNRFCIGHNAVIEYLRD